MEYTDWVKRPWGRFFVIARSPDMWVKTLVLNPWSQTSLQVHRSREEHWHVPEYGIGAVVEDQEFYLSPKIVTVVLPNQAHRLMNMRGYEMFVTEVAFGNPDENDIVRLDDDYGRSENNRVV